MLEGRVASGGREVVHDLAPLGLSELAPLRNLGRCSATTYADIVVQTADPNAGAGYGCHSYLP